MMQLTHNRIAWSRIMALGVLLAALMAAIMLLAARPSHASTTFTVNNTNDSGAGSLRQAMLDANATPGADTINFNIAGAGEHTIAPTTGLPKITGPVTIDGYSQPGAQPNQKAVGSDAVLKIVLSGASASGADGLEIGASNSTIRGLVINRWGHGVFISGPNATGNRVVGNYIGTDASGQADLGNVVGLRFQYGSNNAVGGTTRAARNVISGNGRGVSVGDGDTTGNRVIGNYIGTDATGTKDLGNSGSGVNVDSVPDNTIGGATAGERNVISGNDGSGVSISARRTRVTGNFIGTDATGTQDLSNADDGVYIADANNTVGGTTAGTRNVISGNNNGGVSIYGAIATGNRVVGNYLGTDRSGTKDLGNYHGVFVYDAPNNTIGGATAAERNVASGNYYGITIGGGIGKNIATGNRVLGNYVGTDASGTGGLGNTINGVIIVDTQNNTVGGTTAGARNVIAANALQGVVVSGASATGNRILSNSIFSNGGIGIDVGNDGTTANDAGDADTGANNLQNFPMLSSAKKNFHGTTTVRGKLDSTPNSTFRVQFFSNPKGTNEGKTLLGSATVSTDSSGEATFAFATKKPVRLGQNVTATATGPGGNTSEFSAPRQVVAS